MISCIYAIAFFDYPRTYISKYWYPSIKINDNIELLVVINITHNIEEHQSLHRSYRPSLPWSYLADHSYFF